MCVRDKIRGGGTLQYTCDDVLFVFLYVDVYITCFKRQYGQRQCVEALAIIMQSHDE